MKINKSIKKKKSKMNLNEKKINTNKKLEECKKKEVSWKKEWLQLAKNKYKKNKDKVKNQASTLKEKVKESQAGKNQTKKRLQVNLKDQEDPAENLFDKTVVKKVIIKVESSNQSKTILT